ncbi:hypothetical protein [Embleya hyalina]|uniref:hypothetical protein n=1 Tax=Embleya hyalina TaxID=516124 RepID=UPI000F83B2C2|nr:hypothetical protein [Embleya hyalina]
MHGSDVDRGSTGRRPAASVVDADEITDLYDEAGNGRLDITLRERGADETRDGMSPDAGTPTAEPQAEIAPKGVETDHDQHIPHPRQAPVNTTLLDWQPRPIPTATAIRTRQCATS